jgi:hypothetical protein
MEVPIATSDIDQDILMSSIHPAGLRAAISHAAEVEEVVTRVRKELGQHLQAAVAAFIYPGRVVDLRQFRQLPSCFLNVKTSSGNDRGTRIFRFEANPRVEVNMHDPAMSVWRCEATPISEKTGRDMSGHSHGADSRETVTLYSYLVRDLTFDNLEGEAYKIALTESLVAFSDAAMRELESRERPVARARPKP